VLDACLDRLIAPGICPLRLVCVEGHNVVCVELSIQRSVPVRGPAASFAPQMRSFVSESSPVPRDRLSINKAVGRIVTGLLPVLNERERRRGRMRKCRCRLGRPPEPRRPSSASPFRYTVYGHWWDTGCIPLTLRIADAAADLSAPRQRVKGKGSIRLNA